MFRNLASILDLLQLQDFRCAHPSNAMRHKDCIHSSTRDFTDSLSHGYDLLSIYDASTELQTPKAAK